MDVNTLIATIECYIHVRKGVEVRINPQTAVLQYALLLRAYEAAEQWFSQNNGSITPLR